MDAAVIVVHEVQRSCMTVVLQFLAERFVNRVNRRIPILIERLLRSTNDVEMWSGVGITGENSSAATDVPSTKAAITAMRLLVARRFTMNEC